MTVHPVEQPGVRRRRWWSADALLVALVTLLVLGPLLVERGLVLVGDMVFVPEQPWKDAWTGGDGGVPRAVPSDAWVSLLTSVVPGAVLQRAVLVGIFVGAGLGVSRLTGSLPFVARAAAVVLYLWNPYVHERLAIGHWALLCGYAALPWVAHAVVRLRHDGRPDGGEHESRRRGRAWAALALALAVAGWSSPTGGLLAALTAVVLAFGVLRRTAAVLGLSLAVNLPWIVPALGNGADQLPPDAFGVEAFASRADTPFGVLGSLLTFGGIWKESILPDERSDWLTASVGLAIVLVAVWGLWVGRRRPLLPLVPALVLAVGSVALAWWGAVEALRPAAEWVVLHVPGGGLLRDGQKWVAPWVLVAITGVAQAVGALADWSTERGVGRAWLVSLVLAPVVALPSSALALGGFLHSDPLPDEWEEVRGAMEEAGVADDRVVVLPFSTYRRFDWTPRTVLDPAPRYFPGQMVTEDALSVPEGTVGGESALAQKVREATTPEALAEVLSAAGVRWAVVHRSVDPGVVPAGAEVVVANDQLTLLRLTEPTGEAVAYEAGWRPTAYAALDLVVLAGTLAFVVRQARR